MVHLDAINQEFGIRRVVKDDVRHEANFTALVYCAVTGRNLCGMENISSVERAKSISLDLAKRYYT